MMPVPDRSIATVRGRLSIWNVLFYRWWLEANSLREIGTGTC